MGSHLLDKDLVYHSRRQRRRREDYAQLADCGRVVWQYPHVDSVAMKREVADRIGRPCKQCFPEEK
jgi:hypothetical protein